MEIHVWSKRKEEWETIPFSDEEAEILKQIHLLARRLEQTQGTHPKKHPIVALLEELTSDTIAYSYVKEKIDLLFW